MRELHTHEAGQIVRDFERGMPDSGSARHVSVLIDGQPVRLRMSRQDTTLLATVPADVSLQQTLRTAEAAGLRAEAHAVRWTTADIARLARLLRAGWVRNAPQWVGGPGTGPPSGPGTPPAGNPR